jgi:hypothetical protein
MPSDEYRLEPEYPPTATSRGPVNVRTTRSESALKPCLIGTSATPKIIRSIRVLEAPGVVHLRYRVIR